MSDASICPPPADPQPLPENLRSVQPGGGVCYQIELAWGRLRRGYLRTFRPGYVARMAQRRRGTDVGAPHDVLDPRDLKYCRNQCSARWPAADDPFAWREQIPLARWGLAEIQLMGWPLLAVTILLAIAPQPWRFAALLPGVLLVLVVYFFRDPPRKVPSQPGLVVSPADGKIVEITPLKSHPQIGEPAVRIGIFLSIFNVHINRAPARTRVIALEYRPGEFLNALRADSLERNESLTITLQEVARPYRRMVVRQISGLFARRIVCGLQPGETVDRGEKFGMIKLGSRTELIVPARDFQVETAIGQSVQAGRSVLGHYGS